MPRDVVVVSTKTNSKKTVASNAETWGALKSDLSRAGIEYNGMSAVIRETRNNIELDDARLPEGTFTIFLMPKKVKSGTEMEEIIDQFSKRIAEIKLGENTEITSVKFGVALASDEFVASATIAIDRRAKEEAPITRAEAIAEGAAPAEPVTEQAPATPATPAPTPEPQAETQIPAPSTPAAEPTQKKGPGRPAADKTASVSDKEVEAMRAEAKELGLKIHMKLAKSDPKYNITYKKLFDEAKADHTPAPKQTPAPKAETKPEPKKEEPKKATPAPKPAKDDDDDIDDLLAEARMMGGR